eukprot:Hpha_TRINITY_DN15469_c4_g11::TRINITY_DN15469_c4_g11_i1::g.174588::m.174588/K18752/TNPO1, IPO2, KPNB2; transportin-1
MKKGGGMEQAGQEVVAVLRMGVAAAGMTGGHPDPAKTLEVTQWLQQKARDPTVSLCLAMVAGASGQVEDVVRSMAALRLKNNIVRYFDQAIKPNLPQIQSSLLAGLAEQNEQIRKAMASGVSEVAKAGGVAALGQLVTQLWGQLQQAATSGQTDTRLGCLVCMRNICEDCAEELAKPPAAGQPAVGSMLMPQMVQMLGTAADAAGSSPSEQTVRELLLVLDCLQYLMDDTCHHDPGQEEQAVRQTSELLTGLQKAMQAIQAIQTAGAAGEARKLHIATLRAFKLLTPRYAILKQNGVLQQILPMIFNCTASDDNETALAACEFWRELSENPLAVGDIVEMGLVSKLIEQLLDKMCYSPMELAMLEDEERRSDVKPMLPRRRGAEDDEGDEEEEVEQWTVRDCAACTLDGLASVLGNNLITPPGMEPMWLLKKLIEPRLCSTNHLQTEAAVLALGAIATGCMSALIPQLPGLIQHLMGLVGNPQQHFLVRSMACWTLSRFSKQIVQPEHDPTSRQTLQAYLQLILTVMTDHTSSGARTVQHRALTSFGCLVEASGAVICEPEYLLMITQAVAPCLQPASHASPTNPRGYTTRNVCLLLDSIGLLIRHAGSDLATPEVQQRIFDPLFGQLLPSTPDDNMHLLPRVLQLVHITLVSLGDHAWAYVPSLFERCLSFLITYIQRQKMYAQQGTQDPPDISCAWWAIEIAVAVVECMGHSYGREVEQLCLRATLAGQSESMCQCALVMISDEAMACDTYLIRQVMTFLAACLQKFPAELAAPCVQVCPRLLEYCQEDTELCIDTCWFLGSVVVVAGSTMPEGVQQLLMQVAGAMAGVVQKKDWQPLLVQSAAISLGRCGLVHPQGVGAQLPHFAEAFIAALGRSQADPEGKVQGFQGLLRMLEVSFAVLQSPPVLTAFFKAIADFRKRDSDTTQGIIAVLQRLKQAAGAQWAQILPLVPPSIPADLRTVIGM